MHKLLTPKSSNAFMPSQLFEAKQLLWDILTDNANQENFYMHIRRYTTSGEPISRGFLPLAPLTAGSQW